MSITKEIELMREKIAAQDKEIASLHESMIATAEDIGLLKRDVLSAKLANRMLDESGVDFLKEQAV
jgi:hypothetical protein